MRPFLPLQIIIEDPGDEVKVKSKKHNTIYIIYVVLFV